jgi:hypothetical protein
MAPEETVIKMIEFKGVDFKFWGQKFLARTNRKELKVFLEEKKVVPRETEYFESKESGASNKKNIRKLWKVNELALGDILLSIHSSTSSGKITFNLVDTYVTSDRADGNCRLAWERFVNKPQPKSFPSYI